MQMLKTAVAVATLAFASLSFAQAGAGATTPDAAGARNGGSAPADGAITGGSIQPGESGGVPSGAPGMGRDPNTGANTSPAERAISRCNDLSGTLREQCLLQQQGASTGGTSAPDVARPPSPREAPPPQNPGTGPR